MVSTMNLTTQQQLSVIEHAPCYHDHRAEIEAAIRCKDFPHKSRISRLYQTYLRKIGPNEFECLKCNKPFRFHVGDVENPKANGTSRPCSPKPASKPKSQNVPMKQPLHQLEADQLDADPLEGIITPDCRMFFQSVFCSGSSFRAIVRMDLRTKAHYLADIGYRSFHLEPIQKDLLEFRHRVALGTADDKLMRELTNEQYCSKFIRDSMVSVHKEWNVGELSEQLREAYSKELRNKPQWEEELTGEQAIAFIHQLNGKTVAISALRKMAERKPNLKVPKRNDLYFRDSLVQHYG